MTFDCRWFVKSAAVLEAAYEEVEAGRLVDHPKQATLKKILTGIVTMQPVRTLTDQCVLLRPRHNIMFFNNIICILNIKL